MSKLLRSKSFLKVATSPRAPGADTLGLAFQEAHEAVAQFGAEGLQRGQEETQEVVEQAVSSAPVQETRSMVPEVNVDTQLRNIYNQARGNVNPILVPNQATRAAVGSQ